MIASGCGFWVALARHLASQPHRGRSAILKCGGSSSESTYESTNISRRCRGLDPGGCGRADPAIHTNHRYAYSPIRYRASWGRAMAQQEQPGAQGYVHAFLALAI